MWTKKPIQGDVITWNILSKRSSCGHAPRGVLSSRGAKENKKHSENNRTGVLVRHGNEPMSTSRARRAQSRSVQEKLPVPVVVLSGHFFAQGCVQTAHPSGLGGAVHAKDHEAHVGRSNVLPLGSRAFGASDAGSQHIHQAGSAISELQQQVWMALQAVRARYPEAQGVLGGDANGNREGYSPGNESHMKHVHDQFHACVAAMGGVLVSPRTPSWIDVSTDKGARLDHLVGLGVEFSWTSGAAAWVGSPFQDHARGSLAVKIGTPRPMTSSQERRRRTHRENVKHEYPEQATGSPIANSQQNRGSLA